MSGERSDITQSSSVATWRYSADLWLRPVVVWCREAEGLVAVEGEGRYLPDGCTPSLCKDLCGGFTARLELAANFMQKLAIWSHMGFGSRQ